MRDEEGAIVETSLFNCTIENNFCLEDVEVQLQHN